MSCMITCFTQHNTLHTTVNLRWELGAQHTTASLHSRHGNLTYYSRHMLAFPQLCLRPGVIEHTLWVLLFLVRQSDLLQQNSLTSLLSWFVWEPITPVQYPPQLSIIRRVSGIGIKHTVTFPHIQNNNDYRTVLGFLNAWDLISWWITLKQRNGFSHLLWYPASF